MNHSASGRNDLRNFLTQTNSPKQNSVLQSPSTSSFSSEQTIFQIPPSLNASRLSHIPLSPILFYTPQQKNMQDQSNKSIFHSSINTNSRNKDSLTISKSSESLLLPSRTSTVANSFAATPKVPSSPATQKNNRAPQDILATEKEGYFSLRDKRRQSEQTNQSFLSERSIVLPRIPHKTSKFAYFHNEIVQFPATDGTKQESNEVCPPSNLQSKQNPLIGTNSTGSQQKEEDILRDWLVGKVSRKMEPVMVNQIKARSNQETLTFQNQSSTPIIEQARVPLISPQRVGLNIHRKHQYKSSADNVPINSSFFSQLNNSLNLTSKPVEIQPQSSEIYGQMEYKSEQLIIPSEKIIYLNNQQSISPTSPKLNILKDLSIIEKRDSIDLSASQRRSIQKPKKSKLQLWMDETINDTRRNSSNYNDQINLSNNHNQNSKDSQQLKKTLRLRDSFDQVLQLQSLQNSSQEQYPEQISQIQELKDIGLLKQDSFKKSSDTLNESKNSKMISSESLSESHSSPLKKVLVKFHKIPGQYNYSANYDKLNQQQPVYLGESSGLKSSNSTQILRINENDQLGQNSHRKNQGSLQAFTNIYNLSQKKFLNNLSPQIIKSVGNISSSSFSEQLIENNKQSDENIPNRNQIFDENHGNKLEEPNNGEAVCQSTTDLEFFQRQISQSEQLILSKKVKSEERQIESQIQKSKYKKQNLSELFPDKDYKNQVDLEIQSDKIIGSKILQQGQGVSIPFPLLSPHQIRMNLSNQIVYPSQSVQQRGVLKNKGFDISKSPYMQPSENYEQIKIFDKVPSPLKQGGTPIKRTIILRPKDSSVQDSNNTSILSKISQKGKKKVSFQERILIVDIKTSMSTFGKLARKDENKKSELIP